eukprot:3414442-Pyramimonas_sp.AAC.1
MAEGAALFALRCTVLYCLHCTAPHRTARTAMRCHVRTVLHCTTALHHFTAPLHTPAARPRRACGGG